MTSVDVIGTIEQDVNANVPDEVVKVPKMVPRKRGQTRQTREERGQKKHDWERIKAEFIEGIAVPDANDDEDRRFLTQKALAERHGVDYAYLRKRISGERWNEQKQTHAIKVTRERQRKRALSLAKNAVAFDEKSFKVGDLGMTLVATRLGEIGQEVQARRAQREQALQQVAAGMVVDKKDLYSAIYAAELERLAAAADRFQQIGMRALGTDVQKHEITGADGMPLDMSTTVVNIHAEITRDDPERAAAVMQAMADAGLISQDLIDTAIEGEVIGADVVAEADEQQPSQD